MSLSLSTKRLQIVPSGGSALPLYALSQVLETNQHACNNDAVSHDTLCKPQANCQTVASLMSSRQKQHST